MIRFLSTIFTVSRVEWKEDDNGRYSELTEKGTFNGHIQQASAEMVERFGTNFQTSYSIWCGIDENVEIGDEISDGLRLFTVRAKKVNETGNFPHLQLIVDGGEKPDEEIIGS